MKMPEYATIEVPVSEIEACADALHWATEEAEHHVVISGDNESRRRYESYERRLGLLYEAVTSIQNAMRAALGEGTSE